MKKYLLLIGMFLAVSLAAYAQVNVTFSVDMSVWAKNGYFNPTTDTVRVAGDFNSWSTTANDLAAGTGADSMVFSAQIGGVSGAIHYKFIFTSSKGIQWESDFPTDSHNREATIGGSDMVLPTVFFNDITGKINHVIFKLDMSLPIKTGKLNPASDTVAITGDFTGWGTRTKSLFLTKGASDSVYSGMVDTLASGRTIHFKGIYLNGEVNWENDFTTDSHNREYLVPEKDSSVFSAYWNDQNPNIQTGSGNINFSLDMSVMIATGIFDPSKDSVLLSGGFNGWTTTNPDAFLTQNIVNDSLYFITQTFTNEPFGAKPYKYVVKKVNPTGIDTIWLDGYERPVFRGGDNRQTLFTGEANKDTSDFYDGVHGDWFVPAGTNLKVKFSVNMTPAMDPTKQAVPFNPANDTLLWISEEPAFARTQGWYKPTNGNPTYRNIMTAENDSIWSWTLNIKDPAFNAFEYRYAWISGTDKSWVYEPDALGTFDTYRVRYVGQDKASSFPVNPWNMPTDTWTNKSVKTDQEVDPYESYKIVGVKDKNIQPNVYSLSQNYPNPFNPTTSIDFSIQKPGLVSLKVYNILGQEVATLLNKEMKSGTYTYSFDASNLSSGVYFYKITAGDFVQTKKMLLLK